MQHLQNIIDAGNRPGYAWTSAALAELNTSDDSGEAPEVTSISLTQCDPLDYLHISETRSESEMALAEVQELAVALLGEGATAAYDIEADADIDQQAAVIFNEQGQALQSFVLNPPETCAQHALARDSEETQ